MKVRIINSPRKFSNFLPNFTRTHGGIRKGQWNFRVTDRAGEVEASPLIQTCGVKVRAWWSGTGIVMSWASVWSLEEARYNSQEFAFSFICVAALSSRLTKPRLRRTTNVHINATFLSIPNTARDKYSYTECPRRSVPDFGRVFPMLNYTDRTQNTNIQSWTVTKIMAREIWNFDSCYTLINYQIHIETDRDMWFL